MTSPPTDVLDGPLTDRTVLGTTVIAHGHDETGRPAIAVWNLTPTAVPCGAWVVAHDLATTDEQAARRLLTCLDGRAITAVDPSAAVATLRRVTAAAGVDVAESWWPDRTFDVVLALGEVLERRAALAATIEQHRRTARTAAVLEWSRDLSSGGTPTDFDDVRALASLATAGGAPVVSEALTVARVLRWLGGQWDETEQPKARRSYLHEAHGDREPLPPSWRAATRTAASTRLPL